MRLISLDRVREDMFLGRSIYRGNGELLLKEGTRLSPRFIQRLKDFGFTYVYVYNELLNDISFDDDSVSDKTRIQAMVYLKDLSENVRKGRTIKLEAVKESVGNIVDELIASREIMFNISNILTFDEYTFNHSVNVTVISVMIGVAMYYNRDKLLDLGIGVILHDLGKTLIPLEVINKPGRLTHEEYEIVKMHTWHGYEILKSNPEIKVTSAHVALQHHERFNGLGYPRGLRGKNILEYARISAIADVFDAMTHDRCYRSKFPAHKVYEYLLDNSGTGFDPVILDNFIQKIALFPKGAKILLNDGRSGFVIKQNYLSPFKPIIRLFWDKNVALPKPVELDMLNYESLNIVDVLED